MLTFSKGLKVPKKALDPDFDISIPPDSEEFFSIAAGDLVILGNLRPVVDSSHEYGEHAWLFGVLNLADIDDFWAKNVRFSLLNRRTLRKTSRSGFRRPAYHRMTNEPLSMMTADDEMNPNPRNSDIGGDDDRGGGSVLVILDEVAAPVSKRRKHALSFEANNFREEPRDVSPVAPLNFNQRLKRIGIRRSLADFIPYSALSSLQCSMSMHHFAMTRIGPRISETCWPCIAGTKDGSLVYFHVNPRRIQEDIKPARISFIYELTFELYSIVDEITTHLPFLYYDGSKISTSVSDCLETMNLTAKLRVPVAAFSQCLWKGSSVAVLAYTDYILVWLLGKEVNDVLALVKLPINTAERPWHNVINDLIVIDSETEINIVAGTSVPSLWMVKVSKKLDSINVDKIAADHLPFGCPITSIKCKQLIDGPRGLLAPVGHSSSSLGIFVFACCNLIYYEMELSAPTRSWTPVFKCMSKPDEIPFTHTGFTIAQQNGLSLTVICCSTTGDLYSAEFSRTTTAAGVMAVLEWQKLADKSASISQPGLYPWSELSAKKAVCPKAKTKCLKMIDCGPSLVITGNKAGNLLVDLGFALNPTNPLLILLLNWISEWSRVVNFSTGVRLGICGRRELLQLLDDILARPTSFLSGGSSEGVSTVELVTLKELESALKSKSCDLAKVPRHLLETWFGLSHDLQAHHLAVGVGSCFFWLINYCYCKLQPYIPLDAGVLARLVGQIVSDFETLNQALSLCQVLQNVSGSSNVELEQQLTTIHGFLCKKCLMCSV